MEQLYFTLLNIPMLITAILIGLPCSVAAMLVYQGLPERLKNEKLRIVTVIAFVGVCTAYIMTHYPDYLKTEIAEDIVAHKQSDAFYDAVYTHHPNARPQTIETIKALTDKAEDYKDLVYMADEAVSNIANDYFFGDIVTATDKAVYDYMNHSLLIMETLQNTPASCKSYNDGEYNIVAGILPDPIQRKEAALKAAIVHSSVTAPFPLSRVYDVGSYYETLRDIYENAGYDENDLLRLENISNLPPEDACEDNIRFVSLLTGLGEQQGPVMFKNLMLMGY